MVCYKCSQVILETKQVWKYSPDGSEAFEETEVCDDCEESYLPMGTGAPAE